MLQEPRDLLVTIALIQSVSSVHFFSSAGQFHAKIFIRIRVDPALPIAQDG